MKPIFRYLLLTLASLFVGYWLGHVWSRRSIEDGSKILSEFLALKEYEVLTSLQYKEADPARGRQALLDFLTFTARIEAQRDPSPSVRKGIDIDRGITYMRLASLEAKGGKDSSEEYVREAQSSLKKTGMVDVSEDHLREIVARFDSTSHYLLPYTLTLRARMP